MTDNNRSAGRPQHVPTDADRELVRRLAGVGLRHEEIGHLIQDGVGKDTLYKYYRKELDQGMAQANGEALTTLFSKVMSGDTAACIFWAKTKCGFKEVSVQENTGPDGGPIETINRIVREIVDPNG